MDWRDVVDVNIRGWGVDVHVGILLAAVLAAVVAIAWLGGRSRGWRMTRANFSFAGCGNVDICPDNDVARIAHQAWVEMRTRKAAILFDPGHDVIAEVYNSWYELFRALRELAKNVPAECVRSS